MKRQTNASGPVAAGYRKTLLDKKSEVLSSLGIKFDTLAAIGRVAEDDQAQIWHDEFISLHMNSLDYAKLRMIDEALDRIDSDEYGVCLSCGEPVAPKRLQAVPWARYCIDCQERRSQMEEEPEDTYARLVH